MATSYYNKRTKRLLMSIINQSVEEQISFRIKEVENVLGYVKAHVSSGAKQKALKESSNLEDQIYKLKELLKAP